MLLSPSPSSSDFCALASLYPCGQGLFLADGPHTESTATVESDGRSVVVRIEVEAPRASRVAGVERTRPVLAEAAGVVKLAVQADSGGGQEEALIVLRGEEVAFLAVLRRPLVGSVRQQLIPLRLAWCAPAAAPVGRGSIILRP